eukprot:403360141
MQLTELREELKLQRKYYQEIKLQAAQSSKDYGYLEVLNDYFDFNHLNPQQKNHRIIEMKMRDRENYQILESHYARKLQEIKTEFSYEIEFLHEVVSDMGKDLIKFTSQNRTLESQLSDSLKQLSLQIEKYEQLNRFVDTNEKTLLEKLKEKETQIDDMFMNIKHLEKEKQEISDDRDYYKDKSKKRFQQLIEYEKKYFNIDIGEMHKKIQNLSCKFELAKWKIHEFIQKYGEKLPLQQFFDSPEFKIIERAIDNGDLFDPNDVANIIGDNRLQQQNKFPFDVRYERTDYEESIKRHLQAFDAQF